MQVKKKSQLQEKSVAKDLNAKTVIASGALWSAKADVRSDDYLVECKTTAKPYYSLTLNTWEKIEKEAIRDGLRTPVMCVDLNDGKDRYAVFLENDFIHCRKYLECIEYYNKIGRIPASCKVSSQKSFRVTYPQKVSLGGKTFVVARWNDFLEMLKGEED